MKLIEVSRAKETAQTLLADPVLQWAVNAVLENTPPVDAVQVVHCEDCKHRVLDTVNGEDWCNHTLGLCGEVYATDYCCFGERKDNERKAD